MKHLLLIITSIITLNSFGQIDTVQQQLSIDKETNLIYFERIIDIPNNSKNDLYSKAREWFVDTYNSADDVLQMDDKDNGKLIGKAFKDIFIKTISVKMYYTIKVYLKDGKYKSVVSDIKYQGYVSEYNLNPQISNAEDVIIKYLYKPNGKIRKLNEIYKIRTISAVESLLDDLESHMKKISETKDDEDW